MPSKFRIKKIFKGKLVDYIAKKFFAVHLKPNHVTIMGPILAILAIITLYFGGEIIGSILFGVIIFFIMLFDGVDGALARITGSASEFGGFFDSTVDRYTDVILILGFIFVFDPYLMTAYNITLLIPLFSWVILALLGALLTSYSRSLADKFQLEDTNIGLLGRSERLLVLMVFGIISLPILGLIILSIVSNLTALFRIVVYGRRLYKQREILKFQD